VIYVIECEEYSDRSYGPIIEGPEDLDIRAIFRSAVASSTDDAWWHKGKEIVAKAFEAAGCKVISHTSVWIGSYGRPALDINQEEIYNNDDAATFAQIGEGFKPVGTTGDKE
jgi:hypothetical protein